MPAPDIVMEAVADIDVAALASAVHDARFARGREDPHWTPFEEEGEAGRIYCTRIANAVQLHLAKELRPAADRLAEAEHVRLTELSETADGAYGDGPRTRGAARDALAAEAASTGDAPEAEAKPDARRGLGARPNCTTIATIGEIAAWLGDVETGRWSWTANTRCKYVTVRIDTRAGVHSIADRDGHALALPDLLHQFGRSRR